MKGINEYNELDQFLREKFDGHTIEPAEELWKGIEQRLAPQVVSIHKYSRLKMALYSSAVVIAGLIVTLVVLQTEKPNLPGSVKNETTENFPSEQKNRVVAEKNNVPETPEIYPVSAEKGSQKERAAIVSSVKTGLAEVEKPFWNTDFKPALLSSVEFENMDFFNLPVNGNLETISIRPKKPEPGKNLKPSRSNNKSHRANRNSKPFHISAKDFYAQKSQNKGIVKIGKFLNHFDVKATVTPMITTRTLSNLSDLSSMEFDQKFYNEIERGQISLNGGLELAYNFNKNWSIYSGIKIFQYKQQMQNAQDRYVIISSSRVVNPSSAGNIIITGTGVGQLSAQSQFETKFKLQYLDIPLVARYTFNQRFYFDAGFKYSYLLADKTTVLLKDKTLDFSVGKIGGLQKNNFGLVFGAGMEHTFHSGIRIELGPEMNLNLTNMNPTANVISKPVAIGIRTAIYFGRYKRL